MKLLSIINDILIINENKQLADKIYFNTGLLDDMDKKYIYRLTNGDFTTKVICDLYYMGKKDDWFMSRIRTHLPAIHKSLLEYSPNVFPVKDFDMNNNKNDRELYWALMQRIKILLEFKKLPSIAIRNMKSDIRTPRDSREMEHYLHLLGHFMAYYSMIGNRSEEQQKKIQQKMFKSNVTLEQLTNFVEQKENLLVGTKINRQYIEDIIADSYGDLEKKYDKNNVMIVAVHSAEAIKEIGCNSLWCFTYGENNYGTWQDFSTNDMVYIIIDFNTNPEYEDFMYTLISPLKNRKFYDNDDNDHSPLYSMTNENVFNPYWALDKLLPGVNYNKIFTFSNS